MMSALDPHSNYLSPDNYGDLQERTSGEYSGVGLTITAEGGLVKVISPMDNSPASRAGVQAGDVISAIDGQNASGLSVSDVSNKLRGAMGTSVTVTFLRDGEEARDVVLTREVIKVESVTGRLEGDFGYIRISTFNENTGRELTQVITRLKAEKPGHQGLRAGPAKQRRRPADAAIDVSDAFLERGEIVSQRGRKPDQIDRYAAKPGDLTNGLPLVVLINYGSASASEIVAGALKDQERATMVGLTSFGKGSVQTVIPLSGGKDGALSITTARYYTPSGRSIQKIGIEPDLEVARSRGRGPDRLALQLHLFRGRLRHGAGRLHRGRAQGRPYAARGPGSGLRQGQGLSAGAGARRAAGRRRPDEAGGGPGRDRGRRRQDRDGGQRRRPRGRCASRRCGRQTDAHARGQNDPTPTPQQRVGKLTSW
jgi:C-terminal peptidase prc